MVAIIVATYVAMHSDYVHNKILKFLVLAKTHAIKMVNSHQQHFETINFDKMFETVFE